MRYAPLPFFNDRQTTIDVLMFHCSAHVASEMWNVLQKQQLSCHYIIDTDGTVIQVVPEDKRAWHGGLGSWREIKEDINSHSIGIELSSLSLGQTPYSSKQIESLIQLSQDIISRYHIKPQNIIGHSDSAPTRKADPGKTFPWQTLAQHNIGLWYNLKDAVNAPTDNLKTLLSDIGYDVSTPTNYQASQYAFARHFIPSLVQTIENVYYLVNNVFPPDIDFSENETLIQTAQAVYMRFQA